MASSVLIAIVSTISIKVPQVNRSLRENSQPAIDSSRATMYRAEELRGTGINTQLPMTPPVISLINFRREQLSGESSCGLCFESTILSTACQFTVRLIHPLL